MADVTSIAIRATIKLGRMSISTPDVQSFNVKRSRGQMAATFSASVKIGVDDLTNSLDLVDSGIVIIAGPKGQEKTIFTGIVKSCTITPNRLDASKVILNLSGQDRMCIMNGQKINRRVKTYKDGDKAPERWGLVTALVSDNTPARVGFKAKSMTKEKMAATLMGQLAITMAPNTAYSDPTSGLDSGYITAELRPSSTSETQE